MPLTPERPPTRLDVCLLLGSMIAGVAWAGSAWPTLRHILGFLYRSTILDTTFRDRDTAAQAFRVLWRLLPAALGPPTLMVLVIRARKPHPGRRPAWREPGVVACVAASAVLLAEMANYPAWLLTMYGELTRLQGDARNNVVQLPRLKEGANLAGAIACGVGEHPGLAVAGVFFGFWAAGTRPTGASWIDRLARGIGNAWIVATVGFLALAIRPA